MASRTSTPSRSRSSSNSSSSSDMTMIDAPPHSPSRPARLRNPSHSALSTSQAQSQVSQTDPTFSLLLFLPRELRDRVYEYALVSKSPFWWPSKAPDSVLHEHRHVSVNLLRANKQVYTEAVDILYAQNKFLFTHPSDCNIFRVVAAPASINITSVYFRIREKDLRLWTSYLGSKKEDRSLRSDLPRLRSCWVFLRCGGLGILGLQGAVMAAGGGVLGAQAQGVLGQQMHALQQQVQSLTQVMANAGAHIIGGGNQNQNQIPPPPPPAPAMPFIQFAQGALGFGGHHHHQPTVPHAHGQQNHPPNPSPLAQHLAHAHAHQQFNLPPPPPLHPGQFDPGAAAGQQAPQELGDPYTLYNSFLRYEREMGVESLCLNLRDALPSSTASSSKSTERSSTPSNSKTTPEVKIVCILRIPRGELERLVGLFPQELSVDTKTREARTKFRRLHGVDVSLELNGYPAVEHADRDTAA